jgi:hypothetical protein
MQSLRKRPTYNEVIDYLENDQPKIKYPDRRATFLRNSPYLSQFDGDSWIDLEEQENNINKEKLKEMEVQKISRETQTTAQVLRTTKRTIALQTGGVRNTATSSSGSQTDRVRPLTHEQGIDPMEVITTNSGTQAPTQETRYVRNRGTQYLSPNTQIFDMTMDPSMNETTDDIEMQQQAEQREINLQHERIQQIVNRHLGETEPAQALVASSSSTAPMIVGKEGDQQKRSLEAEDTSNPVGRPRKTHVMKARTQHNPEEDRQGLTQFHQKDHEPGRDHHLENHKAQHYNPSLSLNHEGDHQCQNQSQNQKQNQKQKQNHNQKQNQNLNPME